MTVANKLRRCPKCILSEKYPGISFDSEGICNFCRSDEKTSDAFLDQTRNEILRLADQYRGKSDYDVIVCYSGGKDSTFVLEYVTQTLKLRPLAFTLDNGFIVDDAFKNIRRVTSQLGVDSLIYKPSMDFMKRMYRSAEQFYSLNELRRASAICSACIGLVNVSSIRLAMEKRVNLIAGGFRSGQLPQKSLIYRPLAPLFAEMRTAKLKKMSEILGQEVWKFFDLPAVDNAINISCFNPLPVLRVTEESIVKSISSVGWQMPAGVDACSTNCAMNSYANMSHVRKHGFHPYEFELAKEVRDGLMDRSEAIERVEGEKQSDVSRAQDIARNLDLGG